MAASTKVKFLTGLDTSLDSTPIVKGQILFSIDAQNFGQIWYDKSNSVRVRMTGAADWGKIMNIPQIVAGALATNTASTGITIQLYDIAGSAISETTTAVNGKITIPAANGNGTNDVAGLVTTSAQTFAGVKTFNNAIKAKNDNDFLSHTNEFNFTPALSSNMEIHINHRTAGTNTNSAKITKYHFKDGNGNYTAIKASSFEGTVDWGNLNNVPQAVEGALGSQVTGQNSGNGYKIQLYDLGGNEIASGNTATNGVILIPYASGNTIGLVSATAQTWNGDKTFSNNVSITGTLGVSGVATFNNTDDASSTSTGSVVIKGGLGVTKRMFINDDIVIVGSHRIGRYVDSTHTYTWVYDDYNSGVGGLWIGAANAEHVHAGLLTLHAGLAETTHGYVNQSIKVVIGNDQSDNTGATRNLVYTDASENGSGTQPVYVDSNGKITKTTYSLSATIDSGTANRMAYYSGANKIEDAENIYASSDSLTIGTTSAPANSGKFQVYGISTMQHIYPESTHSCNLGNDNLGWKALYLDNDHAEDLIIFKCDGIQYGSLNIESKGTTSVEGASILYLGNAIANTNDATTGAGNASGQLRLYSDGATFCTYRSNSWSGWGTQEFYTFLGKRSITANDNAYTTLILGNDKNVNSTDSHTEGRLRIFSAATRYHEINGLSTTMNHIHVLPNPNQPSNDGSPNYVDFDFSDPSNKKSTSWIAIGGNGTNLGVAGETQLMYLNTSGTLTASTATVGGFNSGSHKPVYLDAGVITEYDYVLEANIYAGTKYGIAYYNDATNIQSTAAGGNDQVLKTVITTDDNNHTVTSLNWVDAFSNLSWTGGTTSDSTPLTLDITIAGVNRTAAISAANLATFVDGQHKWVRIGGDTMTGNLTINHSYARVNFYDGTRTVMWAGKSNATAAYMGLYSQGYYTTDGTWTDDAKYIVYRAPGGTIYLNGQAARLPDRTLTIGSTGKTFNGTANVSWTLAEIGAAASSHTHDALTYQSTTADVTQTNFGLSSAIDRNMLWSGDKNGTGVFRIRTLYNTDGTFAAYLQVRGYNDSTGAIDSYRGIGLIAQRDGSVTYTVSNAANFRSAIGINTSTSSGTAGRLAYYSTASNIAATGGLKYQTGTSTASTAATYTRLHIWGATYGNTAATLISGTAGLFSFGDGGPQITFDTSETPGGGQAGALIFTDHDTAATGASWHFVSNQSDWNVTSKRFHARTSISIGSDLPNTSYNFVLAGTANHTTGYWYINGGAGGVINGAATNGGLNSIRVGDDVWLGDCNVGGMMGMKSTGNNCGFYFYNSAGTNIGYLYSVNGSYIQSDRKFYIPNTGSSWIDGQRYQNAAINVHTINNTGSYFPWVNQINNGSGRWFSFGILNQAFYLIGSATSRTANGYDYGLSFNVVNGYLQGAARVYSAVWNDYAEFRKADIDIPGYVIVPSITGIATLATERLQAGGRVISDTYGNAVGQCDEARTPVGLAGRVLAYTYRDKSEYHIGDAVCTAPNGTVDIMTREEICKYPDRILGIVNEIPAYEVWEQTFTDSEGATQQTHSVEVKGRIWIDIK